MGFASRYPFFARLNISDQIDTPDFEEDTKIASKEINKEASRLKSTHSLHKK